MTDDSAAIFSILIGGSNGAVPRLRGFPPLETPMHSELEKGDRPAPCGLAVPIVLGNCYRTFRPLTLVAVAGSLRLLRQVGWLK
jgi:hypothetical protein